MMSRSGVAGLIHRNDANMCQAVKRATVTKVICTSGSRLVFFATTGAVIFLCSHLRFDLNSLRPNPHNMPSYIGIQITLCATLPPTLLSTALSPVRGWRPVGSLPKCTACLGLPRPSLPALPRTRRQPRSLRITLLCTASRRLLHLPALIAHLHTTGITRRRVAQLLVGGIIASQSACLDDRAALTLRRDFHL